MSRTSEEQIKQRAFELWEQRGSSEGYDKQFWLEAERELKEGERADIQPPPYYARSGSGSDGPQ